MLLAVGSEICIGDECFYLISSDTDSITMLAKMNITIEDIPKQSYSAGNVQFSNFRSGITHGDYEGSEVQFYVDNYVTYLEGIGANILNARLITKEEVEALGCKFSWSNIPCDETAPQWVYSTSYWTGEKIGGSTIGVVANSAHIHGDYRNWYGIRPVIEISLS